MNKTIHSNGNIYYIRDEISSQFFNGTEFELMLNSDFVIKRDTNEIIKCRIPIEHLVDCYIQKPLDLPEGLGKNITLE